MNHFVWLGLLACVRVHVLAGWCAGALVRWCFSLGGSGGVLAGDVAEALDGGADGLDFYRVICEKWRDALCENGMLFFEVGIGQADQVLRIMRSHGFGDIQIVKDLNNIPRVVYGTRVETI